MFRRKPPREPNVFERYPQTTNFFLSCTAAFVGETVTYPLDMVKTRIQVYGELQSSVKRPGAVKTCLLIIKREGVLALWNGLSPALLRHFVYTGVRMPLYEVIRDVMFTVPSTSKYSSNRNNLDDPGFGPLGPEGPESLNSQINVLFQTLKKTKASLNAPPKQKNEEIPLSTVLRAAAAGIISGAVAQLLASPTDLLKVKFQIARKNLLLNPKKGERLSNFKLMRQIIAEGGVGALWKGGLPNVQRAALVNMGEMTTYDTAKKLFKNNLGLDEGPLLHLCSSSLSSFVSSVLGTPTDLIKTRLMNQPVRDDIHLGTQAMHYNGMIDCAKKVVRNEGIFALYRGFFLMWARMAPWSLTFWLTYEKLRQAVGVGGF